MASCFHATSPTFLPIFTKMGINFSNKYQIQIFMELPAAVLIIFNIVRTEKPLNGLIKLGIRGF
jgi:hypothetical protein